MEAPRPDAEAGGGGVRRAAGRPSPSFLRIVLSAR